MTRFSCPRPSRWQIIGTLLVALFTALSYSTIGAQDDLSVPGLTDNAGKTKSIDAFTGAEEDRSKDRVEPNTSVLTMIGKGGAAMWLLGLFSLALIALAVYCFIGFKREKFLPEEVEAQLRKDLGKARLGKIVTAAAEPDSPTVTKMYGAVCEYVSENGYTADDNEMHRNLIAEAGQKHNRKRARLVNYFTVIAQAAPMAGLLGTVFGMIKAFAALGNDSNQSKLANYISEALVTTASGLLIALPAIFLYFFLRDRLEELISDCEESAVKALPLLRQAAFAATLAEDETLADRENVYDDSIHIEYE